MTKKMFRSLSISKNKKRNNIRKTANDTQKTLFKILKKLIGNGQVPVKRQLDLMDLIFIKDLHFF